MKRLIRRVRRTGRVLSPRVARHLLLVPALIAILIATEPLSGPFLSPGMGSQAVPAEPSPAPAGEVALSSLSEDVVPIESRPEWATPLSVPTRAEPASGGDVLRVAGSYRGGARPASPVPSLSPKAEPSPTPEPRGSLGDRIAEIALKYRGRPYLWGGSSPGAGFDCSGFTGYVYEEAGVKIPEHDLWGQLNAGPRIARDRLQPGDLVFFVNTYGPGLTHGGIYLGGGQFIHAVEEGVGVQINSLNESFWSSRFTAGSRPWVSAR